MGALVIPLFYYVDYNIVTLMIAKTNYIIIINIIIIIALFLVVCKLISSRRMLLCSICAVHMTKCK